MLTHLDPGVRAKLENAFIEAEAQLDYHNQSAVDNQERRVPGNKIAAPIVTAATNTLGFDLNWPKLRDRVISMYEVQISTQSNFSSFSSYNTVDNFFQVEGAASVNYARVRGVRWNGECGPWSQTITVNVTTTASGPVVYSRTIADLNYFYRSWPGKAYPSEIQGITITPQRENGGVLFFGSFGVEFYVDSTGFRGNRGNHYYIGTATQLDESVMVTINGQRVQNLSDIPVFQNPGWSNIQSPPQSTVFGYSLGLGPGYLKHSQFYFEEFGPVFPLTATERNDANPSLGTHTGWLTKRNIEKEYIGDTGSFTNYRTETSFGVVGEAEITKSLIARNFKFNIPSTSKIVGIQLDLTCDALPIFQPMTNTFNRIRLIDSNGSPRPTIKGSGSTFITTTFGGPTDLWGEAAGFWTPAKINGQYFGLDVQGKAVYNYTGFADGTNFFVYGAHLTIYTDMDGPELAKIRIQYKPRTNDFYSYPYTRAILKNCTLNALEFGTKIRS